MLRRRLLILAMLSLICAGAIAAAATTDTKGTSSTPTLKDTLEKGLKARRPEEFQFISRVVAKVDNKTLPESLVKSTFQWAREQPGHPYQYFEKGLKLRAKKVGIAL